MAELAASRAPEGTVAYDAKSDTLTLDLPADREAQQSYRGGGYQVRVSRRGTRAQLVIAPASAFLRDIHDAGLALPQAAETWRAVESSMISAYRYDASNRQLEVVYKRTGVYRYYDVPPDIVAGLEKARSKGSYLSSMIIDQYRCDRA